MVYVLYIVFAKGLIIIRLF